MELIRATIEDMQVLLEMEKTTMGLKTYSGFYSEDEIKDWINNEIVFVIKDQDVVVGSISYEKKSIEHAYISGLVIKPEFRRRGLARRAMSLLLEELKKFKKLSLVVHPENHAVSLYESFGFKKESREENYFGDGEPRLIMVKNI
jgi:ribosomal protein S18 acetylase RimI-like enzyme